LLNDAGRSGLTRVARLALDEIAKERRLADRLVADHKELQFAEGLQRFLFLSADKAPIGRDDGLTIARLKNFFGKQIAEISVPAKGQVAQLAKPRLRRPSIEKRPRALVADGVAPQSERGEAGQRGGDRPRALVADGVAPQSERGEAGQRGGDRPRALVADGGRSAIGAYRLARISHRTSGIGAVAREIGGHEAVF
jgi:hypothetical protein